MSGCVVGYKKDQNGNTSAFRWQPKRKEKLLPELKFF